MAASSLTAALLLAGNKGCLSEVHITRLTNKPALSFSLLSYLAFGLAILRRCNGDGVSANNLECRLLNEEWFHCLVNRR